MKTRPLLCILTFAFLALSYAQTNTEGYISAGDGVMLYYEKMGEGPPDLIVTDHLTAAVALSDLAKNHTVVFYDTRGRGLSSTITDRNLLGMEHEIADLGRVIEHFGVDEVAVLGWSLWGGFVQLYAARYPDKVSKVIAFGPIEPATDFMSMETLAPGPDFEATDAYMATVPDDLDPYSVCVGQLEILLKTQVAQPERLSDMLRKFCAVSNERDENVTFTLQAIFESMGDWDWRDELATLAMPVLIIHGDFDAVVPEGIEAYQAALPDAGVLVIEDAGHMGFLEHPDQYVTAIDSFLLGLWPEGVER